MKKVAIITHNMHAGGAERVIAQLVKYFSKCNIVCNIIKFREGDVFYPLPSDTIVTSIGEKSKNRFINKLRKYINLRKEVKIFNPDVVLAMPEEIGIYVIPALFGTGIPVIVSERNNPWVMPWKTITRLCRLLFYPFAAGIIFQTKGAANFFPVRIRKKGIILPNPLDVECIPDPWEGERRKEIVGAGRLDTQKNYELLILAFKKFYDKHKDYILKIYGDGPLKSKLEKLASTLLPDDAYYFPGQNTELLRLIYDAKMFVLSSNYEGMPNVLIEAMAMGMPVISTNCPSGGPSYLIENGKNGILVPVNDVDLLSEAMCKIADSAEFSDKMGENAQKIRDVLNSNIVAEKWRQYLSDVMLLSKFKKAYNRHVYQIKKSAKE